MCCSFLTDFKVRQEGDGARYALFKGPVFIPHNTVTAFYGNMGFTEEFG